MDQSEPSAAQSSEKQQKIVVVEDNTSLAEIYKTRLELLGYTSFVANDGIAALYLIQKELPDLVLLDLMVPNVAGDEILKRMRASEWGKGIPVFIISNLNEADAPSGLRDLNIVGYVVKANLADDGLDKIVNSILRPNEATQALPTDAAVTPAAPLPAAEPQPVQEVSVSAAPPVVPEPLAAETSTDSQQPTTPPVGL